MQLSNLRHAATYQPSNGWIRKYQKNPSDQNLAVRAAIQTARKLEESVVLVKGNSYGTSVYHIAKKSEDIKKYLPGVKSPTVLMIKTTGEIFQATAE